MTVRCVLHVGMPKCGSSALQTALSRNPDLSPTSGAYGIRYMAVTRAGRLVSGPTLVARAVTAPLGYLVSALPAQIAALGDSTLQRLGEEIAAAAAGSTVALSNEAWGNAHRVFREHRLLERLGLQVEVVIYVRPQVAWCNSAWWQWGAWDTAPLSRWVQAKLERIQWAGVVAEWAEVPGVVSVRARPLPGDVVADFCELFGVAAPAASVVNPSPPSAVLRLFQRHRTLRPGPHHSAIEFALNRHLHYAGEPTPWVLDPELVRRITDGCRASNEALCDLMDPSDAARIREDPAWWSAAHWAGRDVMSWQVLVPDAAESDALAAAAIAALERLDRVHRELLAGCLRSDSADANLSASASPSAVRRRSIADG